MVYTVLRKYRAGAPKRGRVYTMKVRDIVEKINQKEIRRVFIKNAKSTVYFWGFMDKDLTPYLDKDVKEIKTEFTKYGEYYNGVVIVI